MSAHTPRTLPFRKVFGALNPETGEWETHADATYHKRNDLMRKGWLIVEAIND